MCGNELLGGDLLSPSTQKYISLFIANNIKLQYIQQTLRVTYSETLGGSDWVNVLNNKPKEKAEYVVMLEVF